MPDLAELGPILLGTRVATRSQWEAALAGGKQAGGEVEGLLAAIRVLRDQGPILGRPLVDTINGSRHKNMKELRPGSRGRSEVRVLFAFDRARQAILLVGGDKSGNWSGWYDVNIPIADDRFDAHLKALARRQAEEQPQDPKDKKGKRR